MSYRIGFPVDGGNPDLSFYVLVRLRPYYHHSCKNGQTSGLRENSGAAFVFLRIPPKLQDKYSFEFEQVPFVTENVRPDNLAYSGNSDSAACALAIAQSSKKEADNGNIILVSCSFRSSPMKKGLRGLLLNPVANDPKTALRSLKNKWFIACQNKALALVLHHKDAEILRQDQVEVIELEKDTFRKIVPGNPVVVSCKTDDFPLLANSLNLSSNLFTRKAMLVKLFIATIIIIWISVILYRPHYPPLDINWSNTVNVTSSDELNVLVREKNSNGFEIEVKTARELEVLYLDHHNWAIPPFKMSPSFLESGTHIYTIPRQQNEHFIRYVVFFNQKIRMWPRYHNQLPEELVNKIKEANERVTSIVIDKKITAVVVKVH